MPEFGGVLIVEHPYELATIVGSEIPQAAVVPVRGIVPLEAIDDRVKAHTFDRDARVDRETQLLGHFPQPLRAAGSHVARLADEDGAPIAFVDAPE